MRAGNWLHAHGDPSDATGRAIGAEVPEAYCPAGADWRRRVVQTGAALAERALAHLPGA
jgi:hypothetical protein